MKHPITVRREKLGISQADLSKKVGKARETINRIESGFIKCPRLETIQLIAPHLNVSVKKLYLECLDFKMSL